jgi:hypothetical protein
MRFFLLIVAAAAMIGLYVLMQKPEAKTLMETKVKEASALLDPMASAEGKNARIRTLEEIKEKALIVYDDNKEKAQDTDWDRNQLIGAWKSKNDNGRLLMLRADGRCRFSGALDIEGAITSNKKIWVHATMTFVAFGNWDLDRGSVGITKMKFTSLEFKDMRITTMDEGTVLIPDETKRRMKEMREEMPDFARGICSISELVRENLGYIKTLNKNNLTLVDLTMTSEFVRVDPEKTPDPDGKDPWELIAYDYSTNEFVEKSILNKEEIRKIRYPEISEMIDKSEEEPVRYYQSPSGSY